MKALVLLALLITIPVSTIINKPADNESLLNNTPLKQYSFWYSLDNYPKYKLEAAQMVEDLLSGEDVVSENEACQKAIEMVSDKIYEETIQFFLENEDADFTDYEEWVIATQN